MAGTVYGVKCTVYSLQCAKKAVTGQGSVTDLGVLEGESTAFSYVQMQLAYSVSVLLCSRVIELVMTGCLSGGGIG